MALTNKLSAIGDAIREKTGKSELLTLDAMPGEIASIETGGGGSIEVEPIVLTGDCGYACAGPLASQYIELFGETVSTNKITNANYMFYKYENETIPFEVNAKPDSNINISYLFGASKIKTVPKINNARPSMIVSLFRDCMWIRDIEDGFDNNWDLSYISSYAYGQLGSMFTNCYSLRTIPINFINQFHSLGTRGNSYMYTYNMFSGCYSLDEIVGLKIPSEEFTGNILQGICQWCGRLKEFMFEKNEDGSVAIARMKSQVLDLSSYIGFTSSKTYILNYNSGITADKEVKNNATYQALKNDPDWFTSDINYSRYNHDSAVNTINSLPDTSAYLATAGGTNTIKFKGRAGALTDGGAINTLTEEEIAVATAKGWTVSLL